jgi:hypothetical protein
MFKNGSARVRDGENARKRENENARKQYISRPHALALTSKYFPTFFTFCHTSSLIHGNGLSVQRWR